MKIIFILDSLLTGGAERSTLDIIKRLPNNINPVVVSVYNNYDLKPEFEKAGINLICFDIEGKYEFVKAIKLFEEVCLKEKPNLVVATLIRAEIISRIVCKRLNIRNIGTFVNDSYSPYELRGLSILMKLKLASFWMINRLTASFCYRFLSNSESIKASNAKNLLINPDKIDVIYRGRNVSNFNFQVDNRLSGDEVHFLNVGRLLKRKGQYELIEAFVGLLQKHPNSILSIAGEGKYRTNLEALIEKYEIQDKVRLLGNVSNVPSLLRECDIFVFPSYYEGFSGALVEAMLAGAPILASDINMNKEAVEHLSTAYLFKVKDVASLKEALVYAVENKESMKRMAFNARQVSEKRYDIDKIAKQHAELYEKYIK